MLFLRTARGGCRLVVFGPGQQHRQGRHNLAHGQLAIARGSETRRLGGEQLGAAQTRAGAQQNNAGMLRTGSAVAFLGDVLGDLQVRGEERLVVHGGQAVVAAHRFGEGAGDGLLNRVGNLLKTL